MTPTELISVARSKLILDHPFFGVLALRLVPEERTDLPYKSLGTNGTKLYYDPDWVVKNELLLKSGIAHEVLHCALAHISRRGGRDPVRWNTAADYALNPIIKEAGMPLGEGWCYDKKYLGMSAEEIYPLLPETPEDAFCYVEDAKDAAEADIGWRIAVTQAATNAKREGSLPAALERFIDSILNPKVPWREALSRFMTEKSYDDYSWARPNPYYSHSGFYLPVLDGVGMGEVVIAIDTSGSVQDVLEEFGATVKNIVDATRPLKTHVVYCDAAVNHVETFHRGEALTLKTIGGGGTNFCPVFDYVAEQHLDPACLLYLTDMYGAFPHQAPPYPVLWCATTDDTGPFGETIQIKD